MAVDHFNNELEVGDLIVTTCNTIQRPGVIVKITNHEHQAWHIPREVYATIKIAYVNLDWNPNTDWVQRENIRRLGPEEYYSHMVAKKKYVQTSESFRLLKISADQMRNTPRRIEFETLLQIQAETLQKAQKTLK